MRRIKAKRLNRQKSRLGLPDLEHVKSAVLVSLRSPSFYDCVRCATAYVRNMALHLYHRRTGAVRRALRETHHLWVLLVVLAATFLSHPIGAEPTKEIRRILILNEVGTSYPGNSIINEGIQAALNDSPSCFEFYSEYMETGLFPDPADQQEFRDFYLRRYQNRKPDVIITVGPSPLKFMEEVHQRAFPGVPIVFCLPAAGAPGAPALDSL